MTDTLELAKTLIARESVTPEDAGCQKLLADRLASSGFVIEHLQFNDVDNLWARLGNQEPLFVFAGHTDVVPTGPLEDWSSPPFEPTIRDGMLYGRGAADMKSSIAAMITATERFLENTPSFNGSIGFLITSDEEGPAIDGTVRVVETLQERSEVITWCLVGEPSSTSSMGDVIKNGRRGSLGGRLVIQGQQGHVAYPHLARNPIHLSAPAIDMLCKAKWDAGNEFFPPTTFQISNIHAGTGATNVIPGNIVIDFNFRFSTETSDTELKQRVHEMLDSCDLDYDIQWTLSGQPFLTPRGELVDAAVNAIERVCKKQTQLSTSGGTSDGRFIAPTGAQVLELGPVNASIHQVNEHINISELESLSLVYQEILSELLSGTAKK